MTNLDNLTIRGLTRGEIKQFRSDGIKIGSLMDMEEEKRDQALDRLFEIACQDMDADSITPV